MQGTEVVKAHRAEPMLISAALFNFVFAAIFFTTPEPVMSLLGMEESLNYPVFGHLFAVLIGSFGVCYWLAAREFEPYRTVIWLGLWAKLGVFAVVALNSGLGLAPVPLAVAATGDLLYALLFWRRLRT